MFSKYFAAFISEETTNVLIQPIRQHRFASSIKAKLVSFSFLLSYIFQEEYIKRPTPHKDATPFITIITQARYFIIYFPLNQITLFLICDQNYIRIFLFFIRLLLFPYTVCLVIGCKMKLNSAIILKFITIKGLIL